MQIKNLLTSTALLGSALAAPTARDACFPTDIQSGIQNLQGSLNTVILDLAQERYTSIRADYSSTGRGLAYLEVEIIPDRCATDLPTSATTKDQAIAYLQATQAELMVLSQDAINGDCANGKTSICRTVNLYGAVAAFVQSVGVV
ncbi:hypothetical protein MGN70_008935 [Eutypa lata]|nr:hypothetical protein MGN70_008935 [Eutypa lata]